MCNEDGWPSLRLAAGAAANGGSLGTREFTPHHRDFISSPRFLWHSGAPAQERRSTDFIVPLGYCQLTSVAFSEF